MTKKITGEQPFQTINSGFSASPSNECVQIQYSADGKTYSDYPDGAVPAGSVIEVTNCFSRCLFFKLKGNNSTVNVNLY